MQQLAKKGPILNPLGVYMCHFWVSVFVAAFMHGAHLETATHISGLRICFPLPLLYHPTANTTRKLQQSKGWDLARTR